MQLGSHFIRDDARSVVLEDPSTSSAAAAQELGSPGVEISGGDITSEEYVDALKSETAAAVFDKMRKSDAMVRASLWVVELPLRAADFILEPNDPNSAAEKEWAETLHTNLSTDLRCTWDGFMRHAVLMHTYGVMLFEKIIKEQEGAWVMKDLFYPLADYARSRNASIYIRTKHNF